jgi:uncharacterized protein
MSAPVTHVEIMGPDRAQLVQFYGDAFGWKFEPHDEMNYTMFRTSPGGIGGGIGVPQDKKPSVSVYAEVESLAETMGLAQSLGSQGQMGPMDIGGGARIAMISDLCGNVVGLYEGPAGSPPEGSGNPVVWFDIFGPQPEALIEFYRQLFDWKLDLGDDGYAHVSPEKDGIGGGIWKAHEGLPDHGVLAYVGVPNIEEALDRIGKAGGHALRTRFSVGEGIDVAYFTDPAGNIGGLAESTN